MNTVKIAALSLSLFCASYASAATIKIGTNQQGSLFYSLGAALSKVMVEKTDKQYRVSPFAGSSTYIPMMNSNRLDFGFANGGEATFAYLGQENFEGRENKNLRLVGVVVATQTSFAVPTNSKVKSIGDLVDMRVPSGYNSGRTFHYYSNAALASGSVDIEQTKKVPAPNFVTAITALAENRVDAALIPMNVGAGKKAMATMDGGWRYLSLDNSDASKQAVSENLPSARIVSVSPSESKTGVVDDPTHMIEVDFYLLASADVADETVYELVQTMASNKDSLKSAFGAYARYNPQGMVQDNVVPYHEGAIKAYKEMGIWNK
ncbi:TAXI family TRAP transporter solute-binding subunit [Alginatibacterium sediminis]|uniref:TAXI family TRAP transporter solute-binding subunit n=1 Tax=Alginatibacterium sediminis TaxID=2164068 RepID=A0A420E6W3_9ALTE|nr:TAXI family TRAP transporter solute-binding subunit [Alginatibacterium sediminis]RKF14357.1 TAXI family TRAP transporter solute-binding subunit [Alginatibacterium sediminis]